MSQTPSPFIVPTRGQITGLILAGGRGQRMDGADKGLLPLNGRAMVEHIIARLQPQVIDILINANRNQDRYAKFGYRVVPDTLEDYLGPLAGIATGLQETQTDYIVTVPCDTPLINHALVERLATTMQRDNTLLAVAHDGERMQYAFLLLKRTVLPDLAAFLLQDGRSIEHWLERHRVAVADFRDYADAFSNVNDLSQLDAVEAQLRRQQPY